MSKRSFSFGRWFSDSSSGIPSLCGTERRGGERRGGGGEGRRGERRGGERRGGEGRGGEGRGGEDRRVKESGGERRETRGERERGIININNEEYMYIKNKEGETKAEKGRSE